MGLFDMFQQEDDLHDSWHSLTSEEGLNEAIQTSYQKAVALFKHSTRCGISSHAKHRLLENYNIDASDLDFYYLDLLKYRNISNLIADKLKVHHQSPQLIVLRNEKVIFEATHSAINLPDLVNAIS